MNIKDKIDLSLHTFEMDNNIFPNTITMSLDVFMEFVGLIPSMFQIYPTTKKKDPKYFDCEIRRVGGRRILEVGFIKKINLTDSAPKNSSLG